MLHRILAADTVCGRARRRFLCHAVKAMKGLRASANTPELKELDAVIACLSPQLLLCVNASSMSVVLGTQEDTLQEDRANPGGEAKSAHATASTSTDTSLQTASQGSSQGTSQGVPQVVSAGEPGSDDVQPNEEVIAARGGDWYIATVVKIDPGKTFSLR